jgi:signal transduction histidine kinase
LLAVLREALSNTARHAQASRAEVSVAIGDTGSGGRDLVLTVRDNGSGIEPTSRRSGLANMSDRASQLGGTMRAGPAAGGGTELEWRVPLPARP